MDIKELLKYQEGKTLEFKKDLSSLKPVMKTIIAFANTAGGTILIGRDDFGHISGIENALADEEALVNSISDSIAPQIMPEIQFFSVEGKTLIAVNVPHLPGPFYLKTEGSENGVYIRLGSSNRKAGAEILAEIKRLLQNRTFDQLPCHGTNKMDLSFDLIEKTFKVVGKTIDTQNMISLGLLIQYENQIIPSNGGIILFGNMDKRLEEFPDARISCALFSGVDKEVFLDKLDIEKSVLHAIDDVQKFIRRSTRLLPKIEGLRRIDLPEYPIVAIREVLINAIAHADYSLHGMRIFISVFSDRLEIQNPGILPFGMTLDDLRAGVSKIRNRVIVRVLREQGFMEEWGSGYQRVVQICAKNGYPEPKWLELGTAVKVVFYPHPELKRYSVVGDPANDPANDRQQWFIDQLSTGKNKKAVDIMQFWNVSEKTAKRDIAFLRRAGLIGYSGSTKTGQYFIIKK